MKTTLGGITTMVSRVLMLVLLAFGIFVGYLIRGSAVELSGGGLVSGAGAPPVGGAPKPARQPKYACSMFCLPPMEQPGECPVCGMDMVDVAQDDSADDRLPTLTLSPRAERLASIVVAPVERRFVSSQIRLVGKVDYDEYDKARNAPVRYGKGGRTHGRAVARMGVTLDAYETDLRWLRLGQEVTFEAEALPGEAHTGTVVFIDGKLDNFTQTVDVRVRVPNLDPRLKLGMLVRAVISGRLAVGGRIVTPRVSGDWICPMHEEFAGDEPGRCIKCGMELQQAEAMGYQPAEEEVYEPPLVIPVSAPLITGKRAVVYVLLPDQPGVYEGRTVALGPRAADYYLVQAGLAEGEKVVVNGNFKIDSALQILARPSMMTPAGESVSADAEGSP